MTPEPAATWDLVGDLHGHADALEALLRQLGYERRAGAWRHAERRVAFVGDFLDRGPQIRETLVLVRAMLEAGSAVAVLGNHEWNAFAFHLPDPRRPGEFLRRRTRKNRHQVAATLAQVPAGELASHLAFLRQLPLRLELPAARTPSGGGAAGRVRLVHACWDDAAFAEIDAALGHHGGLTDAFLAEGNDPETPLFVAVEAVLKGKEMDLPAGCDFADKDGHSRSMVRTRWYADPAGHTVASYALPAQPHLPAAPLAPAVLAAARPYPPDAPPVFFGHYWLTDPAPEPLAPNVACLDYSVAKGGFLCGYSFAGEQQVAAERFVTAPPTRDCR